MPDGRPLVIANGQWSPGVKNPDRDALILPHIAEQQCERLCGVISESGPNQEPLACGYGPHGPEQDHSWATLPTFLAMFGSAADVASTVEGIDSMLTETPADPGPTAPPHEACCDFMAQTGPCAECGRLPSRHTMFHPHGILPGHETLSCLGYRAAPAAVGAPCICSGHRSLVGGRVNGVTITSSEWKCPKHGVQKWPTTGAPSGSAGSES